MSRRLWVLAALLGLCGCEEDVFQRMRKQPRFLPYTVNPLFGDGRAMRVPPEGTVSWESQQGPRVSTLWREGGAYVERLPLPLTRDLLARGQKGFDIYCATCHGVLGDGRSLIASKMGLRAPPSLHGKPLPLGYTFEVVTLGRGLMGSYASELTVADRWAVVAYVEALRRSQAVPVERLSPELRQQLRKETTP
jgi:mono/diheme cytochrome c family protein